MDHDQHSCSTSHQALQQVCTLVLYFLSIQEHGWSGPVRLSNYYTTLPKTKRQYRSFLFCYYFLDIAIVNAFILNKELASAREEKAMTQNLFRETFVQELKVAGSPSTATSQPPPAAPPGSSHKPRYLAIDGTQGRRRCVLCLQRMPIGCSSCDVSLCLMSIRDCYEQHDQQNL